jgi:hypothetical protein
LESRVCVELGKAFVEPRWQPVKVGMEDAVCVLVVDDHLIGITEGIEPNDGVLLLPSAEELACKVSVHSLPPNWIETAQSGLVTGCDYR